MSDLDALFAAILAAPEDDAPRLVMADWLDEHDQPERAEFIRVQVALAAHGGRGLKGTLAYEEWEASRRRERAIFEAHAAGWIPVPEGMTLSVALVDASGAPVVNCSFARGNVKATGDQRFYFRRGSVATWQGCLRDAIGGPCGCDDAGLPLNGCPRCSGSGRTPGLLRELARTCPLHDERQTCGRCEAKGVLSSDRGRVIADCLTCHGRGSVVTRRAVEVGDREPSSDSDGGWYWRESDRLEFADSIPSAVFAADREAMCRLHPTSALARDALSAALLLHARQTAEVTR